MGTTSATTTTSTTTTTTTTTKTTTSTSTTTTPRTTTQKTTTIATTTTPLPNEFTDHIMLLNEYSHENVPLLLHTDGDAYDQVPFKYNTGAKVFKSCSVKFHGEVFVYGGIGATRQVSKVG